MPAPAVQTRLLFQRVQPHPCVQGHVLLLLLFNSRSGPPDLRKLVSAKAMNSAKLTSERNAGKYLRVSVEPKHPVCEAGPAVFAMASSPVTPSDIPSSAVAANFRNFVEAITGPVAGRFSVLGGWSIVYDELITWPREQCRVVGEIDERCLLKIIDARNSTKLPHLPAGVASTFAASTIRTARN